MILLYIYIYSFFFRFFSHITCMHACSVVSDSMNCSPPGSSVHGIIQAGILEWVAMSSSRGSFQSRDRTTCLLHLQHCRLILYPLRHLGNILPVILLYFVSFFSMWKWEYWNAQYDWMLSLPDFTIFMWLSSDDFFLSFFLFLGKSPITLTGGANQWAGWWVICNLFTTNLSFGKRN